jgi:hypothetical protein
MPLRCGRSDFRSILAAKLRIAAEYAVRAATNNGKDNDFDPDAMVRNFVIGALGYFTEDGLSKESQFNPSPPPPLLQEMIQQHCHTLDGCPIVGKGTK